MREAIETGGKRDILDDSYPYDRWLKKSAYEEELAALQVERPDPKICGGPELWRPG